MADRLRGRYRGRPSGPPWSAFLPSSTSSSRKACSTAFCRSSARTTASGVATSAGTSPSLPVTSKVRGRDRTTESSAIRISEVTISSKGTWSPGSRERISWTMAMERTRRSASKRATRPSPGGQPAGLEPQQGRDGLQVVLDPVVHLADGGVLGQQQPVEPADVGDVAQEHQAPGHHLVGHQRDAVEQHGHIRPPLHLLDHRQRRGQGPLDGRLLDAQIGEAPALDLRVHAHPVEGVGGVGRGVAHPALLVDQHHTVPHPRRLLGGHLLAREREGRLGQHDGEALEEVAVGPLQVAGSPAGAGRQPGQHGHRGPLAPHRDAVEPHRLVVRVRAAPRPGSPPRSRR